MADQIIAVTIFCLGAAIGSFLNVVIYRLPAGLSLLWPPSRCPKCGHQLGITENVPILGWLLLRGRCRHCRTPISARYPLVETLTAIAFVFTYSQFGLTAQTLGYCLLLAWLIALSLIDLDTMTLPNSLTSSGLVLGLIFQTYWGYQVTHSHVGAVYYFINSIIGMVLGILLYDTIQVLGGLLLGQLAQGGGDAKLMGLLGAWLGWQNVLLTGAIASGTGSIIIGGAMALGFWQRDQKFPLGPFLAMGGVISLFAGDRLIATYQQVMFSMSPSTNLLLAGLMLVVLISYLVYVKRSKRRVKSDAGDD